MSTLLFPQFKIMNAKKNYHSTWAVSALIILFVEILIFSFFPKEHNFVKEN
jgi:hypothetical protein